MKLLIMGYLYYNMMCQVTIGNIVTSSPVLVKIESSIKKLSDKATIILPRNFNIVKDNKTLPLTGKNITDFISVGDTVSVAIGYDELLQEFNGYVSNINVDVPLVIECEDEMWKLRQNNLSKSYKSATLDELIKDIAPDYERNVVSIMLGKYVVKNASSYEVLKSLRKDFLLHAFFDEKTLHVGFPSSITPKKAINVNLYRNVKPGNELKFVRKSDFKLQIRAISNNDNGSKDIVTVGEQGGSVRTLNFFNKSKTELEKIARENLKSLSFDGYQGSITMFGRPSVSVRDKLLINDPEVTESEKSGAYLVEEVVKTYSASGYQQKVKLGMKL